MIHEFRTPFPVETPLGQGYALYVTASSMWENDTWCVVLDDGRLLHFTTNQLKYVGNGSYDMKKPRPLQVDDPDRVIREHAELLGFKRDPAMAPFEGALLHELIFEPTRGIVTKCGQQNAVGALNSSRVTCLKCRAA